MKAVMISIKPKWVEKIAIGEKTIEVRKTRPKCDVPFKCYIYCTKPKKWFRFSSWGYASNECLWLSNGKVKMCNGFEFWADGKDYQCVNGKVIGEFVCNEIIKDERGENADLFTKQAGLSLEVQKDYGKNKSLYGWHISDLKIYDRPRELSDFYRECKKPCKPNKGKILCITTKSLKMNGCNGKIPLTRAPQSWQYIEDLGEEE